MNPILLLSVLGAALVLGALLLLVRGILPRTAVVPALVAGAGAALVLVVGGAVLGVGPSAFLVQLALFAVPIALVLQVAAVGAGSDALGRWLLVLVWGVVVMPAATLAPLALTRGCAGTSCGFEDFGGGLPLFVSAGTFVLLAWLPAGVRERLGPDARRARASAVALPAIWLGFTAWLVSLEEVVDGYTPRILLACLLGPVGAALGWLVLDRIRRVRRSSAQGLGLGLLAGMIALAPGAVTVLPPWSIIVAVLAGAVCSLALSTRAAAEAGIATRWGWAAFVAVGIGFLAPPISGDTIGLIYSARAAVISVPLLVFGAVAAGSVVLSAPVWILVRQRATRARIPATMTAPIPDDPFISAP